MSTLQSRSDMGPHATVPLWLLQRGLSPSALAVWVTLASFCASDDVAWPSKKRISELSGVSVRAVFNALEELKEKAGVEVFQRTDESGRVTSNAYRLQFAAMQPVAKAHAPRANTRARVADTPGTTCLGIDIEPEPEELDNKLPPREEPNSRAGIPQDPNWRRPTIEECREWAVYFEMPEEQGDLFFHQYEAQGWVRGNNIAITNIRSQMFNWRQEWLRGQKEKPSKAPGAPTKPVEGQDFWTGPPLMTAAERAEGRVGLPTRYWILGGEPTWSRFDVDDWRDGTVPDPDPDKVVNEEHESRRLEAKRWIERGRREA